MLYVPVNSRPTGLAQSTVRNEAARGDKSDYDSDGHAHRQQRGRLPKDKVQQVDPVGPQSHANANLVSAHHDDVDRTP